MAQSRVARQPEAWFEGTADLAMVFGIAAFAFGVIATTLGVLDPAGHVSAGFASGSSLAESKTLRATSRLGEAADCCFRPGNAAPVDPAPTEWPRIDRPIVAPHADEYRGKTEPLRCGDDLRAFLIGTAVRTRRSRSIRSDADLPAPGSPFAGQPGRFAEPGHGVFVLWKRQCSVLTGQ